ncbi:FAD/NAD(P)-binding oxidoreductase [Psychrosphaera sp. 1_MG-2023]|uniref:NAD(P)/FAD-dependent oxidoreductase n=2 Tax=Psychrosphaera TaxID=907197 RepID=UPI0026E310DC|nr:FAD/NAD(P)-binding oxidoreductase [Psychrosphaera sp. 1_MG-2023]MDO6719381.1 FAD/NAD(P)-binding oxidoreductase [Psychrosphaera sp. 1_MG-2023]
MTNQPEQSTCVIVGASHAGVNLAFSLRKAGYVGAIALIDADPTLPYHRPPLSKAYLISDDPIERNALKSPESYEKSTISLHLGCRVTHLDAGKQTITFDSASNGTTEVMYYSQLVLATGASPIIPPIPGLQQAANLFPLRTALDVNNIKQAMRQKAAPKVVIIGGGYIGLETAASLKKLGADVTVLEREERILARVTTPTMSSYFTNLHEQNDVNILCKKNVEGLSLKGNINQLHCDDDTVYEADIIIVGVGVRVNTELAKMANIEIDNGLKVNEFGATATKNIYAIGDCSNHFNPHYGRFIRLESVQNAVDQAKCVAQAICGQPVPYNTIPWFWSDQFDIKLQMVGLSEGFTDVVVRKEHTDKFSLWYFNGSQLLAVDAVNNAKDYVVATKTIKNGLVVDKTTLGDHSTAVQFL